jgi:hypothetical protein
MEEIHLKVSDKDFEKPDVHVTTKFLIMHCLNTIPKDGFDLKTLRERNRIVDILESVEPLGVLQLEKHDYEILQACVRSARWSVRSKFLEDFLEQFERK